MPIASTPAQYILILIDMMEGEGCTHQQLLAGTTLARSGIANIGARVSGADFTQLASNARTLTGDPALGLKLGLRLNLSAHAVLGQAFMNSRDLAQVMDLFLKYYHLLTPTFDLEFDILDEQCVLTTVSSPQNTLVEFSYELMYAAIVNTLRGLLSKPGLRMRIEVPYAEPAHSALYYEIFGEDVHFDCPCGRIMFNRNLLSAHLPSSNPALRSLYEAECARLLADLEEDDSVAEQTLRLLRKLEGQYPQMPQVARILNLSPRTYRRRLDEEKHSYQRLLDKVRAEHATRYLQNTRLPLSSIAYMIGFNDASNFRRAYRKWTGHSPQQVRNGQHT
ncbi:MAG TPA: AraC family transcriptional regulator [Halieaceae bacterium]|nr:MAG: AraC family transcriptional regulator [Gammaproteobacteria bacterium]HDY82533.1 AraC family transcriptional regulator [Halieaceae bacterium]